MKNCINIIIDLSKFMQHYIHEGTSKAQYSDWVIGDMLASALRGACIAVGLT